MDIDDQITQLCRVSLDMNLSDTDAKKIQSAIKAELDNTGIFDLKPIMTMDEVAAYLRVDASDVEEYLGDIPCFEFAGKLRFRKDAVDRWIERKEQSYAYAVYSSKQKEERMPFLVKAL